MSKKPAVRIFTKQFCPACRQTERLLDQLGVSYQKADLTADQEAVAAFRWLGYFQLPIVLVDQDGEVTSWTGFRPGKIRQFFAKEGHLV